MTDCIGWYGQGQLSIVTVLGTLRALVLAQSLSFLLFDSFSPAALDTWVEIEPFKTAVTTYFVREWYFVAYALLWLLLGLFVFRRYVCPLGAVMAIGGWLRLRNWIPRCAGCGTRCQLCAVRCQYDAIEPSGRITYDECFQYLDCVTLYGDRKTCPPLVLAQNGRPLCGPLKPTEPAR